MPIFPTARSRLSGQMFGNEPAQNINPYGAAARISRLPGANRPARPQQSNAGGGGFGGWVASAQPTPGAAAPAGNLGSALGGNVGIAGPMPTETTQPVTAPRPMMR